MQVYDTWIEIEQELLFSNIQDTKNYHDNYDKYLAILQIKTMERLYKKKGIFDKFY